MTDHPGLPVVDLSGWGADKLSIAEAVRAACIDSGFFYVVGHGVPASLTDGIMSEARRLFALPEPAKLAVAASSPSGRGYARMGGRNIRGDLLPAVKEEFFAGREPPVDEAAVNRWPADLPGFRETLQAYLIAMHGLAEQLMAAIALSLGLPEAYFADFCAEPIAALRLVRYPPEGAEAGIHTDYGALTLLLQDPIGGLQVFDRVTGGWIEANPIAGSFVVNLGDLMERWTNKLYRSTPHRVVHRASVERVSAPFFFTGAANYPVACLPPCRVPGERPAYMPTTPAAHLRERSLAQGY